LAGVTNPTHERKLGCAVNPAAIFRLYQDGATVLFFLPHHGDGQGDFEAPAGPFSDLPSFPEDVRIDQLGAEIFAEAYMRAVAIVISEQPDRGWSGWRLTGPYTDDCHLLVGMADVSLDLSCCDGIQPPARRRR